MDKTLLRYSIALSVLTTALLAWGAFHFGALFFLFLFVVLLLVTMLVCLTAVFYFLLGGE